ncbi:MAG: hypothetical protein EPO07_02330 [Verrucomicrobia bacterium]|nr:MAG: hypothetical protein EPO07_02330 [Verrucomicrobiota bacterium]
MGDEKALAEITRLQVVEALLPRRIANREEAINYNEATLLKAGHDFISQHLGPRIRSMVERAKKSARARLETDFPDALALDLAVDGSALVRELDGFLRYATLSNYTGDDLTRYAERLLRTWSDCDAREAKLS